MTSTRVLIVDDDPLVRIGLRLMLRAMPQIEIVAEADDGSEVLAQLDRTPVDVILSDVRMRLVNGTAIVPTVRAHHPHIRIVLMSSAAGEDFAAHARNAGADAFIPKTAAARRFAAAITGDTADPTPTPALSERETAVAQLVAHGASNAQISIELSLSINTVKTYVSRVMSKLGLDNRVQLANYLNERATTQTND